MNKRLKSTCASPSSPPLHFPFPYFLSTLTYPLPYFSLPSFKYGPVYHSSIIVLCDFCSYVFTHWCSPSLVPQLRQGDIILLWRVGTSPLTHPSNIVLDACCAAMPQERLGRRETGWYHRKLQVIMFACIKRQLLGVWGMWSIEEDVFEGEWEVEGFHGNMELWCTVTRLFKMDSNSHGCVAGTEHTLCITSGLVLHRFEAALSERILL